jgi:hypothetical protein
MKMHSRLAAIVFLVSSIGLWAETAQAASHRDTALHYTVELPANWVVMRSDELARINSMTGQRLGGQKIQYATGFRPRGAAAGSYPFVLVQSMPLKSAGMSYEQIEQSLAKEIPGGIKKAEGALSDLVSNAKLGSAVLDRKNNRILMHLQMDVIGVGKIQAVSLGHIGSEGVVFLHCYALKQAFDKHMPDFENIDDGFQFDEGYTFKPSASEPKWVFSGGLVGGIVGAVVAGAVGVGAFLLNLGKAKPR